MSTADLTTTSYAILGLLGIRPWTMYELAQQMERSLRYLWPRAQSRIYAEPKRLVEHGLAKATQEMVGRRPRTTYRITAKGRRALHAWLARPGSGPSLEFEALLKVFFAEHGSKADALAHIATIRAWAGDHTAVNVAFARQVVAGTTPFPQRAAMIVLIGRFLTDLGDTVAGWAEWAAEEIENWPDDLAGATPNWDEVTTIATRDVSPAALPPPGG